MITDKFTLKSVQIPPFLENFIFRFSAVRFSPQKADILNKVPQSLVSCFYTEKPPPSSYKEMSTPIPSAASDYQRLHIHDSRLPEIIVSLAVCLPAANIAVILRFISRRVGRIPWKADDWWLVVGLVSLYLHFEFPWTEKAAKTVLQLAFHHWIRRLRRCCYSLGSWPPRNIHETPRDLRESTAPFFFLSRLFFFYFFFLHLTKSPVY